MSDPINPITEMTTVTLTCIVEISPSVRESDLAALSTLQWILNVQLLNPDGTPLAPTGPAISQSGRIFMHTVLLGPFMRTDRGNYSCMANPNSSYLALAGKTADTIRVTTGKKYM